MKKVALISLGCAKNLVDSEVMLGYLLQDNYTLVTDTQEADVLIVNTCGFIQPARDEADAILADAAKKKIDGKCRRIIAVGCYVQRNEQELRQAFPEVDVWMGVTDFDKIVSAVKGAPFERSAECFLYNHKSPRIVSTPAAWAYLKISEGCSHKCSFCVIPQIKGPYRSRSISSIKEESIGLVSRGFKEINLISQDSTFYGRDLGSKQGLVTLLAELINVKGLEWIRVLYGHPGEITDPLLEIMTEEKICSYLDIPFQHAHPKIIRIMNRGMDGQRALRLIERIRRTIPEISLRTSLIVGFPGEGHKEFLDLKDFIRSVRFDHLGVFTYSPEEGTDCQSLGDPIKERVKQERLEEIFRIQADISRKNNRKYLGRKIDVLIEGRLRDRPDVILARGRFQAPEVDGVVLLHEESHTCDVSNPIQKVEITDTDVYDLSGKLIP